ncbi:MAG: hypothetical protein K2L48_02820 [Mycoplasmoidaceae bacterium]|nr:hypothetical protein [Mycoplasmoidaceae bacterium]
MYTCSFADINGNNYQINITDTIYENGNTIELKLSDNPLVISLENSDDIIFKPYKGSNAAIEIITSDLLNTELYSPYPHQKKVEIFDKNRRCIWVGFITPNLYNQGYANPLDVLTIECIDGISTLQYYDYECLSDEPSLVCLYDIIESIADKCECYENCYIADTIKAVFDGVYELSDDNIINSILISEKNFFDNDGKPLKYNEVLEHICKYLNLTCIAHGKDLYFIDYYSLKGMGTKYTNIQDNNIYTFDTSKNIADIQQYAGNSHNISLDEVYNKVSITDSFYNIDEIFPDIYNNSDLYSITSKDTNNGFSTYDKNNYWRLYLKEKAEDYYNIYTNFLTNPNVMLYYYIPSLLLGNEEYGKDNGFYKWFFTSTSYPQSIKPSNINNKVCGALVDCAIDKVDGDIESSLSGSTNLVLYLNGYCDNINTDNVPLAKITYDTGTLLMSTPTQKQAILIKGNFEFVSFENDTTPVIDYHLDSLTRRQPTLNKVVQNWSDLTILEKHNLYYKGDELEFGGRISRNDLKIKVSLYYGGKYWNGLKWVDEFSLFNLQLTDGNSNTRIVPSDWSDKQNPPTHNKQFKVMNNVHWMYHIDEDGYLIDLPNAINEDTTIELTFYTQCFNATYNTTTCRYNNKGWKYYQRVSSVWITDLEIKSVSYNTELIYNDKFDIERMKDAEQSSESDTLYTNIIDENYINEFEDDFKICTHDNKKPNYSCVYYKDDNGIKYLDETYNIASGEILRQEEHYIYKIVNQYSLPAKIFEVELHDYYPPYCLLYFPKMDNYFAIIDGYEYNVKYNINKLILKEAQ